MLAFMLHRFTVFGPAQNMTCFWELDIHPKMTYFGKENILDFKDETVKEQRNFLFWGPKLRYFP
jgi:hypothetical protein